MALLSTILFGSDNFEERRGTYNCTRVSFSLHPRPTRINDTQALSKASVQILGFLRITSYQKIWVQAWLTLRVEYVNRTALITDPRTCGCSTERSDQRARNVSASLAIITIAEDIHQDEQLSESLTDVVAMMETKSKQELGLPFRGKTIQLLPSRW